MIIWNINWSLAAKGWIKAQLKTKVMVQRPSKTTYSKKLSMERLPKEVSAEENMFWPNLSKQTWDIPTFFHLEVSSKM